MRRRLRIITLMFLVLSSVIFFQEVQLVKGATGDTLWSKTYGGVNREHCYSLIQASDGGFALAGMTASSGAGSGDFFLVKTDSAGNQQWSKTYGSISYEQAFCVIQTNDAGYALAGYSYSNVGDVWLVKTDTSVMQSWNKSYGGTLDDVAWSVIQTDDGGYALAGMTSSFGAGGYDFWLIKTDANGNHLWNKAYGGMRDEYAYSMIQTNDGGYILAGTTTSFGAGYRDFWVVKTDVNGNQLWNFTCGRNEDDWINSIVKTADGGYALAGVINSPSNADYWLVKIDGSGKQLWNKSYGGIYMDVGWSLIQTSDNGFVFAGSTSSYGAGKNDSLLIRTDSLGNQLWNRTYGGTQDDYTWSIGNINDGSYIIGGDTASYGAGNLDCWLVKVSGDPVIPEFSSWIMAFIFVMSTLSLFALSRRRNTHNKQ